MHPATESGNYLTDVAFCSLRRQGFLTACIGLGKWFAGPWPERLFDARDHGSPAVLRIGGMIQVRCFTLIAIILLFALQACGPSSENSIGSGEGNSRVALDEQSVGALRERYSSVIEQFPDHPQSEEVLALLLNAIETETNAKGTGPREALMYVLADEALGQRLFEERFALLTQESRTAAQSFAESVRETKPSTRIALRALQKQLDMMLAESPERFLARCDELIRTADGGKESRIALFRRLRYYTDVGSSKLAALDALRFWSLYPDTVENMNLSLSLAARLREGGFLLEGNALEVTEKPHELAEAMLSEFNDFDRLSITRESSPSKISMSESYFRYAPDLEMIAERATEDEASVAQRALYYARMGRIALEELDLDRVEYFFMIYLDQVERLVADDQGFDPLHSTIEKFHQTSLIEIAKALGPNSYGRRSRTGRLAHRRSESTTRFLSRFSRVGVNLSRNIAGQSAPVDARAYAAILDRHIEFLQNQNDASGILNAYEEFIDLYPDSKQAPLYMYKKGLMLNDSLNSPTKATEVLGELASRYPESPQAIDALLKRGLILYESGLYEEAYEVCQLFIAEHADSRRVVSAKFMAALSESAMGLNEESEVHMREIIEQYSSNMISARAIFFLGSRALSRQDYDHAQDLFEELVVKYPESSYARQAQTYISRLLGLVNQ